MISNLEFLEILPSIQEACIKAGKMQKKYHKTDIDISTKANKTPVTKIDIDSNTLNRFNSLDLNFLLEINKLVSKKI